MDALTYLTMEIPKHINGYRCRNYALLYHWIKIKRFLALNIMAFSFQYLCIYHLHAPYPLYAIYPAIGIAFTVIAILGENAIAGLLLGGICAYFLKGHSFTFILLYSMADVACAYVAAYACRTLFMSDIPRLATIGVWGRFIVMMVLAVGVSALLRVIALVLSSTSFPEWRAIFYYYIELGLADLNAIILFYAFLSTWLSVYMSREKLSTEKISIIHLLLFITFIIIAIVMMKKLAMVYLLWAAMITTWYVAYRYGIVIATLMMYVISMLYLSYFMAHQLYYVTILGMEAYTLAVPGLLFVFIVGGIFVSVKKHTR
jgi:hypothetical protein